MSIARVIYRLLIVLLIFLPGLAKEGLAQHNAEVLSKKTNLMIDENGLTEQVEIIVKINNKAGLHMTDVSIYFNPRLALKELSGQIEDVFGNVLVKLKKRDIVEASSISGISLYEDEKVKTFKLSHGTFPFILRYSYVRQSQQYLALSNWSPVIDYRIPVKQAVLELTVPAGFKFKTSLHKVDEGRVTNTGNTQKVTWKSSYDAARWKRENLGIPVRQLVPRVNIVPKNFHYGLAGSFESWSTFGDWLESLSEGLHDLPYAQKEKVKVLTSGLNDPKEKVRALYHFMQDNTRYINVAIGFGGMKPYPASYVAANKYGDCKALTNYMQALLKEAGIDSYCVDVKAGSVPDALDTQVPRQAFNHVILAVPLEKDTVWLENTSNTSPFGYLGTFTQNRKGLWVNGSESSIVDIPGLRPEEVGSEHDIDIQVKKTGITATVLSKFKGEHFEELSYLDVQGMDKELSSALDKIHPYNRSEYDNLRYFSRDRDDKLFQSRAEMDLQPYVQNFGGTEVLFLPRVMVPSLKRPNQRKMPLVLASPIRQHDKIHVEALDGMVVLFESEDVVLESEYGRFEISSEVSEEGIKIERKLNLHPAQYSLEEYEGFYEFLQKIKGAARKTLFKIKST